MSQLSKKFIKLGTGTDQLNARDVPANFASPSAYTPTPVAGESSGAISAHLKGIDNALSTVAPISGDIAPTSFSAANNQSSAANVTGLLFNNASIRSFEALVSVSIDATADLFESFVLHGVQKSSSWAMNETSVGDISGFTFTITNAGQIQYTNNNYSGFVTAVVKFRAITTAV